MKQFPSFFTKQKVGNISHIFRYSFSNSKSMAETLLSKIGTHSGCFHTDEVLACTMLTKYTKQYFGGQITRTRDQALLDQMDIVVDVGGIYEPSTHRYDHHQRTFTTTFGENYTIKLSSAGLVYKHFGEEIILNLSISILEEYKDNLKFPITITPQNLKTLHNRLYDDFIMGVDGADNGINKYSSAVQPNYSDHTNIQAQIHRLNPMWTEKNVNENDRFKVAMEIANKELRCQASILLLSVFPAYNEVKQSVESRTSVHPSGAIVKLETPLPWGEHLDALEKELGLNQAIKFMIFPESEEKKAWRVQGIRATKDTYDLRVGLKEEWRGIKDMKLLVETSKIEDIVFVHNNGFIGGAKSFESVLRMALESLEAHQSKIEKPEPMESEK